MKTINEYCKANLINEYLSTKVKNVYGRGFPDSIDMNAIIRFLDANNFVKCKEKGVDEDMKSIYEWFEKTNKQSYILKDYSKNSFWLRIFKGGSKVNRNNPMFVMQIESGNSDADPTELYGYESPVDDNFAWSHELFIEEINKHFGWDEDN